MKKIVKIIICAMLSILLQCGVLLYLDRVLFKESKEFTIENIDITVKSVDTDVNIPTNAQNVQVSYSGRYITYFIDNKFILVNTKTSEVKQILDDTEILSAKWVPNNNVIWVVEKASNEVKVKSYNANNGVEQPVCELCTYRKNMQADSFISISAEYISINEGNSTRIYRVDIDKNPKEMEDAVSKLGSASVFLDNDVFFYEDSSNKSFYRYTKKKKTKMNLKNSDKLVILKAAGNMIYMGEYSENSESKNKIAKVIYGEDQSDPSGWKTVNFEKPEDIKNIYINESNEIFVNNSLEGKVKNITTNENITYKGKFISVNDRIICSSDNGKVYLKSVKDVDKTQEVTKPKQ